MSRTVVLSDELFGRLSAEAHERGHPSVEQFLQELASRDSSRDRRGETVERIESLRADLRAKYGEMPASTHLVRDDRLR